MAKKPTTLPDQPAPAAEDGKRRVAKIDMSKPFAVILHQTEARNHFEVITQADCEGGRTPLQQAALAAAGMALNQNRTVAVFGPQEMVKIPPAEPKADNLALDFNKPTRGDG